MSISDSTPLKAFLNLPLVSRVRRNHGLEHATLHVLAKKYPNKKMAGHSDFSGFWLLGDIPSDDVQSALHRMNNGEQDLAVHPNCGTNLVAAGTMAGMAGLMGMLGVGNRKRDKLERLPLVATLATLALMLAQPLGPFMQKHVTTSGTPESLQVVEIIPTRRGRVMAHRVVTQG